ncbi:MAG: internal scaffolding protein [Microviridae sp.]|nr:MAG: internal scaffolding protein [Microviridae sp.]
MSQTNRIILENKTIFANPYSPNKHPGMTFPKNSEYTKQEFKNECDINVIMAQYQYSGEIPNLNTMQPVYQDCTGLDYMEHMNKIVEANNLFADLPSKIRNRFNNDPALFLDFVHDENNRSELQSMGLLRPVSPVVTPHQDQDSDPS